MENDNTEDVELAAQRMLDEAGPEKLKRFLDSYEREERANPADLAATPPRPAQVTLNADLVDRKLPDTLLDFKAMVQEASGRLRGKISEAEKKALVKHCEEYLATDDFKREFAQKSDTSSIRRIADALGRLQSNLRSRKLDFDLGFTPAELKELLLCDGLVRVSIPLPRERKLPKGPLVCTTTYPLRRERHDALSRLVECLPDLAAWARHIGSESERDFKLAYVETLSEGNRVLENEGNEGYSFGKKVADDIVQRFFGAYHALFADAVTSARCRELWGEDK